MSLESDARTCLLAAIKDELIQVLEPSDLSTAKPSDPDFKCNYVKWRQVLDAACVCLRDKGHDPGAPTNEMAKKLLDKTISRSLDYLIGLAEGEAAEPGRQIALAPILVAAVGTGLVVATAIAVSKRRRRGRRSRRTR